MTATEVIEEIKKLPHGERRKVLEFLKTELDPVPASAEVSAAFKAAANDVFDKNEELFRKLAEKRN